jgi:hypothetical protein
VARGGGFVGQRCNRLFAGVRLPELAKKVAPLAQGKVLLLKNLYSGGSEIPGALAGVVGVGKSKEEWQQGPQVVLGL